MTSNGGLSFPSAVSSCLAVSAGVLMVVYNKHQQNTWPFIILSIQYN